MIEQLPEREDKLKPIREHKMVVLGGFVLFLIVIFFILLISGRQDCEITSLKDGVIQTCRCRGMEITVRSTTSSREKKTVCLGQLVEVFHHKER